MSVFSLPVRLTRQDTSIPDLVDRLDALRQAELDVKAAIRFQFDSFADKFGIKTREVDRAMESIDDTVSDLIYEIESDLQGEIIDMHDADR